MDLSARTLRQAGLTSVDTVIAGNDKKPLIPSLFIRRRGVSILFFGTILGLLILLMNLGARKYSARGIFVVKPSTITNLAGRERELISGDVNLYQSTLAQQFLSLATVESALNNMTRDELPRFLRDAADPEGALGKIRKHLEVKSIDRSYQIELTINAEKPEGISNLLGNLMTGFVKIMERNQEKQFEDRINYLRTEKESVELQLKEEREKIINLSTGMANREILRQNYSSDMDQVGTLQKIYLEAQSEYLVKEALSKRAAKNLEEISRMNLQGIADGLVFDNLGINEISQWTYSKCQELRSRIDGLTQENPERKLIEARMEAMNQYMDQYKKDVRESTLKSITEKRAYELQMDVIKAQNDAIQAKKVADDLGEKLMKAQNSSSEVSQKIYQANQINYTIDQLKDRLSALQLRIDDTKLDAKAPLPFYIDSLPEENPHSEFNLKKAMMMAMAVGFGFPLFIFALIELMNPYVEYRQHLNAALGALKYATVCVPMHHEHDFSDGGYSRLAGSLGHSLLPNAFYEVGFKLCKDADEFGSKVFGVASCEHGDGASFVSMGVHLALRGIGRRSILIELPIKDSKKVESKAAPSFIPPSDFWSMNDLQLEGYLKNLEASPSLSSELFVIPWGSDIPLDVIRSRIGPVVRILGANGWIVLLDLSSPMELEFSKTQLSICDVIVIVTRQSETFYKSVRSLLTLANISGVKAVTAVLNQDRNLDDPVFVFAYARFKKYLMRVDEWVESGRRFLFKKYIKKALLLARKTLHSNEEA